MQILVVYDSVFGNTERIAKAIGEALSATESVELRRVGEAKPEHLSGLEMLIVGSPTRAFKPTKATTDFLKRIPSNGLRDVKVAAFDTRISEADINSGLLSFLVKRFGYAAKPIAEKLEKKGGSLTVPAEGFFVKDTEGPLKDGEIERAASWAKKAVRVQ